MQVNVGTALSYRGKQYICIAIEQLYIEELAKEDSESMLQWLFSGDNVRCLEKEITPFKAGDVIIKTGERIMLECPGVDVQWIWTKYSIKLKGEESNELIGIDEPSIEGSDNQVESPGLGDSSGAGDGPEDIGKAGS